MDRRPFDMDMSLTPGHFRQKAETYRSMQRGCESASRKAASPRSKQGADILGKKYGAMAETMDFQADYMELMSQEDDEANAATDE